MQFKVLPEPVPDVERVAEMQAAVPLVPDEETSCCARLMQRTGVASQDRAKEWLTFLRALRLVEEDGGQYRRLPHAADPAELREAFIGRVYLAEEVLELLDGADDPLDVDAVFDRVRADLPQWERLRHTDPEAVWRERIYRLLEWAVVLGLAARADGVGDGDGGAGGDGNSDGDGDGGGDGNADGAGYVAAADGFIPDGGSTAG